jgi:hypothetical protein
MLMRRRTGGSAPHCALRLSPRLTEKPDRGPAFYARRARLRILSSNETRHKTFGETECVRPFESA